MVSQKIHKGGHCWVACLQLLPHPPAQTGSINRNESFFSDHFRHFNPTGVRSAGFNFFAIAKKKIVEAIGKICRLQLLYIYFFGVGQQPGGRSARPNLVGDVAVARLSFFFIDLSDFKRIQTRPLSSKKKSKMQPATSRARAAASRAQFTAAITPNATQ